MNKPGCFSSASVFSHDSEFCRKCEVFKPCSDASLDTLKRVRATVDVDTLIVKHQMARQRVDLMRLKSPPTASGVDAVAEKGKMLDNLLPEDREAIARITSTKTAAQALAMAARGDFVDTKARLQAGVNPLAGKKVGAGMSMTYDLLLAGGFTSAELVTHMRTRWDKSTAESQASIAVAILTAFQLVDYIDRRYVIAKGSE